MVCHIGGVKAYRRVRRPAPVNHERAEGLTEPSAREYQGWYAKESLGGDGPGNAELLSFYRGTSSVVVALDLARPRSRAYLTDPGVSYFSR